jgi:hypothetical protein
VHRNFEALTCITCKLQWWNDETVGLADEWSGAPLVFAAGDFVRAVSGFEQALALAPDVQDADETRLMIAVIHVRKAPDAARARAALAAIGAGLPAHMQPLAEALRAELAGGAA